jgi:hypothetical protein
MLVTPPPSNRNPPLTPPRSADINVQVTKTLATRGSSLGSLGTSIGASLVPTVVSVINSIMPPLIQAVTTFERWDGADFIVKQLVFR